MMADSANSVGQKRKPWDWLHILWAGLFFALLSVVMTWPLALHIRTQVVGELGDNIYFVWLIEWIRRAIFDLHVSPVPVSNLNYPQGWSLAYTEITPAQIALAMPFALLDGPVFGYNMALLATFVLSGLAMYLWIVHLTGRRGAGLVAGMIYAFLPFHMAHFLIGHLNLTGIQWLPFYFWGFYDLLRLPKPGWKPAVLAAVMLCLLALTSQYYMYMAILLSPLFALGVFLVQPEKKAWIGRVWKSALVFVVVAAPLVVAANIPYIQLSRSGEMPNRTVSYVRMYSASPTDFLLPSTRQWLWGNFIGSHFDRSMWIEATLYVGAVALALAILAWLRRKEIEHRLLLTGFCWVAVAAFILALGTDFHWLNQSVSMHVPAFLQSITHKADIPIPLPGYFMFLYFPFFAKMRALMRFGLFVLLPVTTFAGLGSAWLLGRVGKKWAVWVTVGLLVLVFVDIYPGPYPTFTTIQPRPVDAWLAAQPGQGAVAQFPFSEEADQQQTYYTLFYQKPYIGGFFAAFPPTQYARIEPTMQHFPDADSLTLLKQLGVEYVVVDSSGYADFPSIQKEISRLGMPLLTVQGNEAVYGVLQ